MPKPIRKLLDILDGVPAADKRRQRGQSLVELALVTPIFIIMLAGLVEIGWFANNYLNILDVTRYGARRGTVLQDQQSPLFFNELGSHVPHAWLTGGDAVYRMGDPDDEADRLFYRYHPTLNPTACGNDREFYNEIICTMLLSFDPLTMNPDNGIDDIIISGFAIDLVPVNSSAKGVWLPVNRPVAGDVPQMVVVGRYPTNANECDLIEGVGTPVVSPQEFRDPFDINANGVRDVRPQNFNPVTDIGASNNYTELVGADPVGTISDAERQRGFSLYGNRRIPNTLCIGSDWTMRQVEDLFNLPNFLLITQDDRSVIPGQGMILVEMYWEHEMLLKMPLLSPVFTAVGDPDGKMIIYIWSAFPLPTVEPFIIYG